ncbi:MAG: heavy-metal-associated domain-containing protein [Sphingobacteriaceae bacterium]|nr:heavy-metal-associated domain-containing protein [Sphingobacteriaceae bacterium]
MEKYQFKTTINCAGCVAKVTPHLNANENITSWEVDIKNPEKILTVEAENTNSQEVAELIEKLGFEAQELS